VVGTGCKYFIA